MKRLYLSLVTLVIAILVFAPVTHADEPARTRFFDFSGWTRLAQYSQLRQAATPTPRYNKVIYPLPEDAEVIPVWDMHHTTMFYTYLSMEEVMDFYRTALTPQGATEREALTLMDMETKTWFSLVFDTWDPVPGRSVVIQGVRISPYQYAITIRLEAL